MALAPGEYVGLNWGGSPVTATPAPWTQTAKAPISACGCCPSTNGSEMGTGTSVIPTPGNWWDSVKHNLWFWVAVVVLALYIFGDRRRSA